MDTNADDSATPRGVGARTWEDAGVGSTSSMQPGIGRDGLLDGLLDTTGGIGTTTKNGDHPPSRLQTTALVPPIHPTCHKPHACHMHAGHGSGHGDADAAVALDRQTDSVLPGMVLSNADVDLVAVSGLSEPTERKETRDNGVGSNPLPRQALNVRVARSHIISFPQDVVGVRQLFTLVRVGGTVVDGRGVCPSRVGGRAWVRDHSWMYFLLCTLKLH